ncbi:cupin domain-containing protein [Albidovulum sp.]|jgi:quercetin dioxygenase-like cupin family protein|uniref:cupin domain-containing protein n=1 Tax=Albidovulum sp. TaxID=1872424 RepID=UPI00306A7A59
MPLPAFIRALPALDLPFPDDAVRTNAVRSDAGLVVFFTFLKDFDLPPHSHKGQWGTVLEGAIELTLNGVTRRYGPGEPYDIAAGTVHSARIPAGTVVMDVFEEPDRYRLRG